MAKFLDANGLGILWEKIKSLIPTDDHIKEVAETTKTTKIDLLWSGSSNGNFTFSANYDDYDLFICYPIVTTSAVPLTAVVMKDMLGTSTSSSRNIQTTDEAYFYTATLYRSGTTTMGIANRNASNNNCRMTRIYGVKL